MLIKYLNAAFIYLFILNILLAEIVYLICMTGFSFFVRFFSTLLDRVRCAFCLLPFLLILYTYSCFCCIQQ